MKTLTIILTGLLLFFFLTECTTVKRFRSASYKGEDNTLVDMSLSGSHLDQVISEPEKRNLWDLSAGAQTRLIQILNERYPENEQFAASLNMEYLSGETFQMFDFTRQDLRMVFTISKNLDYTSWGTDGLLYSPADRIESVKYSLNIPPEYGLHFEGWNRYSTEYGEIEIADVSFSRSLDLSADISTDFIEGGVKRSSGRKEDQSLRSRYIKLSGSISPLKIEIEAEGNREIELAGNVVAEVSLAFEGFPERVTFPVFVAGDTKSSPVLTQLAFRDVLVPRMKEIPDTILATLEMDYVYRHVRSGWKSYQEWDDRVEFYSGSIKKPVLLFCRDQYVPPLFCLGLEDEGMEELKIRSPGGRDYPLQFIDYRGAQMFLEWLLEGPEMDVDANLPLKAVNYHLLLDGQLLTPSVLSSLDELRVLPVY